jgi:hypothetical protein
MLDFDIHLKFNHASLSSEKWLEMMDPRRLPGGARAGASPL